MVHKVRLIFLYKPFINDLFSFIKQTSITAVRLPYPSTTSNYSTSNKPLTCKHLTCRRIRVDLTHLTPLQTPTRSQALVPRIDARNVPRRWAIIPWAIEATLRFDNIASITFWDLTALFNQLILIFINLYYLLPLRTVATHVRIYMYDVHTISDRYSVLDL